MYFVISAPSAVGTGPCTAVILRSVAENSWIDGSIVCFDMRQRKRSSGASPPFMSINVQHLWGLHCFPGHWL